MSFLAPLFFLGALGLGLPIYFHLIRRTTREVAPFSSLMFLEPAPPRVTRRSRLNNLWLLLLRCLALALLACGFARPFLLREMAAPVQAPAPGRRLAILVDASASMRREDLWEAARRAALAECREAGPADEAAILLFDRTVRTLVSFAEWRALEPTARVPLAEARLAAAAPSWASTHLDTAFLAAAAMIEEPNPGRPQRSEIVLISDLQEGSHTEGLQGFAWPRGATVRLHTLRAKHEGNASMQWLAESEDAATPADTTALRVRISNAAGSKQEQFSLSWDSSNGQKPIPAYVPAGQSRIVQVPAPADPAKALVLAGDEVGFDNRLFVLPPVPEVLPVLFLGTDAEDDPKGLLYYLQRGFPPTRRQSVRIERETADVPASRRQEAKLLILGRGVSEAALESARQFARAGGISVLPLSAPEGPQTLSQLFDKPGAASEAVVKDYALLAQIEFHDPLFQAFADPRFSDFSKIHFWKYRRIDPGMLPAARVLARFDTGDPAIVQAVLGKGSVLILASTWTPADSLLALSSKFVPLLQAILEESAQRAPVRAQYYVGEVATLPTGVTAVHGPDGTDLPLEAGGRFSRTETPGLYTALPAGGRFVVNLPPEESRLLPLPPSRLEALGVPLQKSSSAQPEAATAASGALAAVELENRQKLWRWVLLAAFCVLLLETLIAGTLTRRPAAPSPAS